MNGGFPRLPDGLPAFPQADELVHELRDASCAFAADAAVARCMGRRIGITHDTAAELADLLSRAALALATTYTQTRRA